MNVDYFPNCKAITNGLNYNLSHAFNQEILVDSC
jgi:hypothetical protein